MDNQIVFFPIGLGDLKILMQESVKSVLIEGLTTKEIPKNDICNLDEAVEITGLQKSAIYKLTMLQFRENDSDPMPYWKSGKFLRFKRSELQAWCDRRLVRPDDRSGVALTLSKSALRKR